MASGKRASMREGPLAALFRRTDEADPAAPAEPPRQPEAEQEPSAPRTPTWTWRLKVLFRQATCWRSRSRRL